MKRYHGSYCTRSFPRSSRDNPLRSEESLYGPYTSPRISLRRLIGDAVLWILSVAMFVAMFKIPAIWTYFFGG